MSKSSCWTLLVVIHDHDLAIHSIESSGAVRGARCSTTWLGSLLDFCDHRAHAPAIDSGAARAGGRRITAGDAARVTWTHRP